MSEPQIDPYKLNQVLEDILENLQVIKKNNSEASPEFQILMSNYLTKANEAERNQARLEESLERLNMREQDIQKAVLERDEINERLDSYQRASEILKQEFEKETQHLREEIATLRSEKEETEKSLSSKFERESEESKEEYQKQINYYRNQLSDVQKDKTKLEKEFEEKEQESLRYEQELKELKTKVMQEQANIRDEIIETSKRSTQAEQRHQEEKDLHLKQINKLESQVEELQSTLKLKETELEYKSALLEQTIKSPKPVISSANIQSSVSEQVDMTSFQMPQPGNSEPAYQPASMNFSQDIENLTQEEFYQNLANQTQTQFMQQPQQNEPEQQPKPTHKTKDKVGGMWSRFGSQK